MRMTWRTGRALTIAALPAAFATGPAPGADGPAASPPGSLSIVSPPAGGASDGFLSADLRWRYPTRPEHGGYPWFDYPGVTLRVSLREDLREPIAAVELPENRTSYRLAVAPETTYWWEVVPRDESGPRPDRAARARFATGKPRLDAAAPDEVRYRNPRAGAHWRHEKPVEFAGAEPLSPWYDAKAFVPAPLPRYEEVADRFPRPVLDGHPEAIEAYRYSWKTLLGVWYFPPSAPDHQAVANICGIRSWGPWGSTMVFDTAFILHFARYGHQVYPFITALDNCYARQHENGFICRETDKDNREVYVWFPVNPPLFAWAEWEWYRISGDRRRLERVLLPIAKHYEWFVTYMRRENGLYWTNGAQEADDSPRNGLLHYAVSATSYQALAARCLALIAAAVGRDDLRRFFDGQHRELADLVNRHFWDEAHGIYNDLDRDGRPITELKPGSLCKHVHMFWPLAAGVAPPDRAARVIDELRRPASFWRRNGVPSLSADSAGYNADTGQYWRGAVWPSGQCMVQEGLRACGRDDLARELAEKYWRAQVEVFRSEKTIKENMAPDRPLGCGVPEFVGWGGLGPVANLIEGILGLEIDAPAGRITWRVTATERHGIEGLKLGSFSVDLICAARAAPGDPLSISVKSGGSFTLRVVRGDRVVEAAIAAGERRLTVE